METCSPPASNPFATGLKARWVVLGCALVILGLGMGLAVLETIGALPLQPEDPLLAPVLYILLFSILSFGLWLKARRSLRLRLLVGTWPAHLSVPRLLLLMVGVFLFSLGAFQVSYLLLSLVAPEMVEATLQQSLLLSADDTAFPETYNRLILFSAVIVAPITEEFLFRGILLHRWATKWSLSAALISTSILFGVLHSNLVGLFVFGLVMGLLYLQSRCLWVPILAHALNNAIASVLEFLTTQSATDITVDTLAEFRSSWWLGILCLVVSAPGVIRYIFRNWPRANASLPYLMNQRPAHLDGDSGPAGFD